MTQERAKTRSKKARKQGSPRGPIRRPRSILILECDTRTLARDGLSIADQLSEELKLVATSADRHSIKATSELDLNQKLGECVDRRRDACDGRPTFDLVILIGHSNRTGFVIAPNVLKEWKDLEPWLGPLAPARIVLVACEAGRERPVRAVFEHMPSLREIYATPGYASTVQVRVIALLTAYLMNARYPQSDVVELGTLATAAFLNEPVFCWKRTKQSYHTLGLIDRITDLVRALRSR